MNPDTGFIGCFPTIGDFLDGGRGRRGTIGGNGDQTFWPSRIGGQGGCPGFGPAPQYREYKPEGNAQPQAFMHVPGQGGSSNPIPLQIPFQVGPSGGPMPTFGNTQPMTVKLTAPPGAGANGQPITFQLDPSIWMGAGQKKL